MDDGNVEVWFRPHTDDELPDKRVTIRELWKEGKEEDQVVVFWLERDGADKLRLCANLRYPN